MLPNPLPRLVTSQRHLGHLTGLIMSTRASPTSIYPIMSHCLTKSLPWSSSPNHHHSQRFLTLHQDHLFASVPLHKGTEVAMMRSLKQIFHEVRSGVAVVEAERFRIGSFPGRQTWEREYIFKADVHCSGSSPRSIERLPMPKNVCRWMSLPRLRATIAAMECGCLTMRRRTISLASFLRR